MAKVPQSTDGALDQVFLIDHKKSRHVPAIFIHAGAGFHSYQNEQVHLEACTAAAKMGMKFLKAGATATEAIEASLKVLEDKEVTNAGYGSNLTINGVVECDATVVDHLGRSGACGAVPNVRNPISLAKLILDTSSQPLTLRRVPPNLLVGVGARDFALKHGMTTVPNERLVSKNSKDRFLRWQEDLRLAEAALRGSPSPTSGKSTPDKNERRPKDKNSTSHPTESPLRGPRAAILAGTWNEGQPDSPNLRTPTPGTPSSGGPSTPGYFRMTGSSTPVSAHSTIRASGELVDVHQDHLTTAIKRQVLDKIDAAMATESVEMYKKAKQDTGGQKIMHQSHRDGTTSPTDVELQPVELLLDEPLLHDVDIVNDKRGIKRGFDVAMPEYPVAGSPADERFLYSTNDDVITDTIGAIAIDDAGRIAAGSSSGGIGMKHRGRLGPAALVGIGTAVVPVAVGDEDGLTVATVTSGTGEHMATTMASQRCAERIYHGNRKGLAGRDVLDDDDDAIMESFIQDDFMDHPGVKIGHSAGAIGVMIVKKRRGTYYFYFAHNTDSFALASFGGNEREPRCVMSRLAGGAKIGKGGLAIRTT